MLACPNTLLFLWIRKQLALGQRGLIQDFDRCSESCGAVLAGYTIAVEVVNAHCNGKGATARPLEVMGLAVETSLSPCPALLLLGAGDSGTEAGGEALALDNGGATLDWAALIRPCWVLLLCI